MLRKSNSFVKFFSLSSTFLFQFVFSVSNDENSKIIDLIPQEKTQQLITFVINNCAVDLKNSCSDGVLEGAIRIQIGGQLVDESFKLDNFDIETQKKIYKELMDFFFDGEQYNHFNLKRFDKKAAQDIRDIICSYFKIFSHRGQPDATLLLNIVYFLKFYYFDFPEQYIPDLEKIAFEVVNTNQIQDTTHITSLLNFMIQSRFIKEDEEMDFVQNKDHKESYSEKIDSQIIESLEFAYSLNSSNLVDAVAIAYDPCLSDQLVKKLYHKYKEKSSVSILVAYHSLDPCLTEKRDILIPKLEQLIKTDLGVVPLSYLYVLLSKFYDLNSEKKEEYLKLSLHKNYMYTTVYCLAEYYLLNNYPEKATRLFLSIINNLKDYKGVIFTQRKLHSLYFLSLQLSMIKQYSLSPPQIDNQVTQALLEQQEEALQNQRKLKEQFKEKRHQRKVALIKEVLQKYHEEQERLTQQKKEKEIIEQQQKERFEKDKQAWTLENQNGASSSHVDQRSTQKKKKKKKAPLVSPPIESTISAPESISEKKTLIASGITIESLIKGNPLKIFYKFFEGIGGDKTDQQVQISMKEVETLMKALSQKVVSGHGSHKKVEMDLHHIDKELENKVLVLAKHTYLLPYQIKQIREKFLDYGLCSKDLLHKLNLTNIAV